MAEPMSLFGRIVFTLTLFFLIVAVTKSSFAYEEMLIPENPQRIYSDNPFYPVKRLWEKFAAKLLIFDDAKVNFEKKLLNTRFSELKYSVENKLLDEIQRASERFSYQAGVYTEKIKGQNDTNLKKNVLEEFKRYASDAAKLRSKVPEGSFSRLLQYDVDTLKILSDQLR